jgi:hypothetical protein
MKKAISFVFIMLGIVSLALSQESNPERRLFCVPERGKKFQQVYPAGA